MKKILAILTLTLMLISHTVFAFDYRHADWLDYDWALNAQRR
jgi:hypothetical protein